MIGPLISGIGSVISGFLSSGAQRDANAANAAIAAQNIELQRQFAQNAIRWKVKDAERAGVHPLYALGANTTSFSPVSVGAVPETGMANAVASMGQNLGRAVAAPAEPSAKVGGAILAQQQASNALDLETKSLNNQLLRAKLANMLQPGTPPGIADFPVPEKTKAEERPPLMLFGRRWATNPNTSPMKAFEDQYGDEGPVSWILPPFIAANDAAYNIRRKYLGVETGQQATDKWVDNYIGSYGSAAAALMRYYQAAKSRLWFNN